MKEKILIIEDDLSIAQLQKDYLEINDMEVEIVSDGQKALEIALEIELVFDLIIVDVMLPHKNGFEILKEIRKKSQVPIMIVSAKKEDYDKVRGLGLGANDYLVKPFSPNELVARVKAHILRYQSIKQLETSEEFIGDAEKIVINKLAHKVYILHEETFFTHMEYELLLFFIEHPNRVWSKEELFEYLWGYEVLNTDVATVVVHIKRIREKIKRQGLDGMPIETVWGIGYRYNL